MSTTTQNATITKDTSEPDENRNDSSNELDISKLHSSMPKVNYKGNTDSTEQ